METPETEIVPVRLPPGTDDIIKESNSTLRLAEFMEVDSPDSYEMACEAIVDFKDAIKAREKFFRPIKQAMDAAKKIVLDKEREAVNPLQRAIDLLQPKALNWKREQERQQEAERRRLEEIERKAEEDRRLEEAARLEKNGEKELAEQVLTAPVETPQVVMPPAVQKVSGLSTTKRWTFEIIDPLKVARVYLMPDEVKIGKQVQALGAEAAELVGGIRVFQKESFTRRA